MKLCIKGEVQMTDTDLSLGQGSNKEKVRLTLKMQLILGNLGKSEKKKIPVARVREDV